MAASANFSAGAARAASRSAQSKLLPRVSATGYALTGSYSSVFPSAPNVDPANLMIAPPGPLVDGNVMLMAPLWTGGRLQAEAASAKHTAMAASADRDEILADVRLSVADAFLRAKSAQAMVASARSKMDQVDAMMQNTKALVNSGKEISATLLRVEAEAGRAKRDWVSAAGDAEKARIDLLSAMGADLASDISLADSDSDAVQLASLESYVASAKLHRKALKSTSEKLKAAASDSAAIAAGARPQVFGVAFVDGATQEMNRGSAIGLTVSIPLFDAGERRAALERAHALRSGAESDFRSMQLSVDKEVREAYIDAQTSDQNSAASQESVDSLRRSYDVVALRVRSGKGIFLEQLEALQSLHEAETEAVTARYQRDFAYLKLLRVSGAQK